MFLFILVICLFVQYGISCPSGCDCRISKIWCENVDEDTIFIRNTVIRSGTFVECYINVQKVMKAFPNLRKMAFINSVVVNCPEGKSDVTITGACDEEYLDSGDDGVKSQDEWKGISKHTTEIELQIQTLLTFTHWIAKNGWIVVILGILSYVTLVVAAVIRCIYYIKTKQLEFFRRRQNTQQVELGSGRSTIRNRQIPPRTIRTRSMTAGLNVE